MDWSPDQEAALKTVESWYRSSSEQVFRLFGYAGTGKTTLARHLAESTGGRVAFAAYTGKAASVLVSKGCPASTIHSLIYIPYTRSKQKLRDMELQLDSRKLKVPQESWETDREIARLQKQVDIEKGEVNKPGFVLNENSEVAEMDLLIIDECSMVGMDMGQDLLSFGTKILVLGDPAQLPPVASGGFFTEHKPDYMLTGIHRQAENDPIIHLATMVRTGKSLKVGQYGISRVMRRSELTPELPMAQDQIICGRNATRHGINTRCRELLGFARDQVVVEGEKVVCLRNNHDLGILNGTLWAVDDASIEENLVTMALSEHGVDNGAQVGVTAWSAAFNGDVKEIPWWDRRDHEEFDYGYALTCHKSQGSQWDNVMVFDESGAFKQDAQRWLYTALTRASKSVTVVI